jgi:hypothetical protein
MLRGLCPLCKETKEIVSSHLIPARVYEYCRPPGSHPIAVSAEYVNRTDRQTQDHLLCLECEDILNRGGETWLLPLLASAEGSFPFYDILTRVAPDIRDDKAAGYAAANNPDIPCDKLTHFAIGVFWKASVHSWRGKEKEPMIELGPYREDARKFLRGESEFPIRMTMTIGILPPPVKLIGFEYPCRGADNEWHSFTFYIPGIRFVLNVGRSIDEGTRRICFVRHPARPIIVYDFSAGTFAAALRTLMLPRNIKRFEKLTKEVTRSS